MARPYPGATLRIKRCGVSLRALDPPERIKFALQGGDNDGVGSKGEGSMGELAGSLYVVSTAAFASIAAVVGIRLLLLSAETGQMAERLLGFGLLLTASLGYGVMMVAAIGRSMLADPSAAPAIYTWISTTGWIFHNIGVMCLMGFVVHVFRHGSVWARTLAATMSITLWAGWATLRLAGRNGRRSSAGRLLDHVGGRRDLPPLDRRRVVRVLRPDAKTGRARPRRPAGREPLPALGARLAHRSRLDLVCERPRDAGATLGGPDGNRLAESCLLVTGALGTATVVIYWLTFFPPVWYRRRFIREGA